jgi:thioredoxin 2
MANNNSHLVCAHCGAVNRIPTERLRDRPKCGQCKQALFSGKPVELGTSQFNKFVSRNDVPVVVDFWAQWCGPCKMMAPVFAETASRMEPQVRFAKVDTEREQALAAQFGIRSIPTLAIFSHGREIARQAGAMDARMLENWIRQYLP